MRPQDAPRLRRLREILARRWQRRRRRQVVYLALACVALAVAISLVFAFYFTPERAAMLQTLAGITLATPLVGVLSLGVYAIWRYDRTRRRLRGAQIRLRQVEHRLRSVQCAPDGVAEERPLA